MKLTSEDRQVMMITGIMITLLVLIPQISKGQVIHDNVAEDEVIVCINGNVIGQSGNICKVFTVDGNGYFKQDITLDMIQSDLYKNPDSDTFLMDVRD